MIDDFVSDTLADCRQYEDLAGGDDFTLERFCLSGRHIPSD
jgi:hypothetical protein